MILVFKPKIHISVITVQCGHTYRLSILDLDSNERAAHKGRWIDLTPVF